MRSARSTGRLLFSRVGSRGTELRARALGVAAALAAGLGLGGPQALAAPNDRPDPPRWGEVQRATPDYRGGAAPSAAPRRARGDDLLLFPGNRVVSFYGAPQMTATILGRKSPRKAARKLRREAAAYERRRTPVVRAFDLVAVIATASAGADGMYRFRQPSEVIAKYLRAVRRFDGRLVLDVQPGRSDFLDELRALRPWLALPDVDLALDPEWNVGPRGRPGVTQGSVSARKINRVSAGLQQIIDTNDLPPKLLVVHQFREGSIRRRGRIRQREDVQVTLNFDGIGSPRAKRAGYAALAREDLFNGFSLFYLRDSPLMVARQVLRLVPPVNFVLYQ